MVLFGCLQLLLGFSALFNGQLPLLSQLFIDSPELDKFFFRFQVILLYGRNNFTSELQSEEMIRLERIATIVERLTSPDSFSFQRPRLQTKLPAKITGIQLAWRSRILLTC